MASISKERLREMEEEMDRFEAEIQVPGGPPPPGGGFILGANTYDKVQAQLTSLRQESARMQKRTRHDSEDGEEGETNMFGDEDLRTRKRKFQPDNEEEEGNEFHDIDERPGRPQGPLVPPPPPPPPSLPHRPPPSQPPSASAASMFAPPPPPPPEPEGEEANRSQSTLSFKPYAPGEGPRVGRPAFMPPQLRHRAPPPPGGQRPPFPRPPMRMGGPPGPGGSFGPMGPQRPPHMMGPGPHMGHPGPGMPGPPLGPPMGMPGPHMPNVPVPGMEPSAMQFMSPSMEETQPKPTVLEAPKVVYSAKPVITVERKKDEKKKKKKKKGQSEGEEGEEGPSRTEIGPNVPMPSSIATSSEEDKSLADMEIVADAGAGGIVATNLSPGLAMATGTGAKKEKKKKEKKFIRLAASTVWEDPTLAEWQQDDFRMFCGDLGNEVTDETLVRAFNKYPSFLKAKVIRDRRTNKTKGYGFVSFKDPVDFTRAMREMNGKYVGNRPIKLRKSNWKDRNMEVVKRKEKEKKKLGLR